MLTTARNLSAFASFLISTRIQLTEHSLWQHKVSISVPTTNLWIISQWLFIFNFGIIKNWIVFFNCLFVYKYLCLFFLLFKWVVVFIWASIITYCISTLCLMYLYNKPDYITDFYRIKKRLWKNFILLFLWIFKVILFCYIN